MKPIIVTGFWDAGRGGDCPLPRTNERYFLEFEQWARIKNRMIIFIDTDKSEKVLSIRKKYGLDNKTIIIPIDNIYEIEEDIYKKMQQVENQHDFTYKLIPNAMSCIAKFDYAWLMCYWCIAEAAKLCSNNELLAWFDFGFNHMDHCYTDMTQFDFEWDCTQTNMNKIHLFSLVDINEVSIWDCLQFQFDTIMSPFQLIPAKLAQAYWNAIKQSIEALLTIGVIDDDQMLQLIACKNYPDLFEVHISKMWYLALKESGADHLKTNGRKVERKYNCKLISESEIEDELINNRYWRFCDRILERLKRYELSD